jgi:uncharacterized protein (DUF2236 family)
MSPASAWIGNYVRSFTIQMLPDRIREGYGLKKTTFRTNVYKFRRMHTRATARMTPKVVRHSMKPLMLYDMRRSAKRIQTKGKW